jgi:hypothetical protein
MTYPFIRSFLFAVTLVQHANTPLFQTWNLFHQFEDPETLHIHIINDNPA